MDDLQARFVLNMLAYAAQKDVSPEQLCGLCGIDLHALKKKGKASLSADNTLATGQNLQTRISNFLLANTYLGIPSLEELAANFNTSARSLQRKLQEEGVTYQQIVDTIRKSLALHYLQSGNYPLKEISYILGYNEISAFNRAFKRWTGTTPLNYQEN